MSQKFLSSFLAPNGPDEANDVRKFALFMQWVADRGAVHCTRTHGGRSLVVEFKPKGNNFLLFFHPFQDKCYVDGRRRAYQGLREISELIEELAATPPPPKKHPIGYQRVRPDGFHKMFKKVKR